MLEGFAVLLAIRGGSGVVLRRAVLPLLLLLAFLVPLTVPTSAHAATRRTAAVVHKVTPAAQRAAKLRAQRAAVHARRVRTVMHVASALRGRPYRYGATGPRAFDCSGYTGYVLRKAGVRMPRTAQQQYNHSHHISKRSIKTGDLVFFRSGGHVYHVGIYAGHGKIWHAPHTGSRVRLERIWTSAWVAGRAY